MSSEISYFVSYACPNCRRHLEARSTGWDGWLRCPVCKWPSLPPEVMIKRLETRGQIIQQDVNDDVLFIPGSPRGAVEPGSSAMVGVGRSSHTTPARLIFTTGFALSLFLVLVAFLDDRMGRVVIFGILAVGFFLLLVRSPRNRMDS
jgi:hypothetical protein